MELVLVMLISLIVIVAVLANRLNDNSFPFPFDSRSTIFTPAEKNFHNLLEQAVGAKFRVINRVKLSDIVNIRKGVSSRASQSATNNAETKYLDFVICERDSMKLIGAVDLVDTRGKGYKVKKDWFVSGALEAASIPHVRIKVKNNYTLAQIKQCIHNHLLGKAQTTRFPKVKGSVIPPQMLKAKSKPTTTGALTKVAVQHQQASHSLPQPMRSLPH
jgi:hypothetical protein